MNKTELNKLKSFLNEKISDFTFGVASREATHIDVWTKYNAEHIGHITPFWELKIKNGYEAKDDLQPVHKEIKNFKSLLNRTFDVCEKLESMFIGNEYRFSLSKTNGTTYLIIKNFGRQKAEVIINLTSQDVELINNNRVDIPLKHINQIITFFGGK